MSTRLNASKMLSVVLAKTPYSPTFGKKVYTYLLRVSPKASGPVTYLQKRELETVTGKANPGEYIVVQVKGEYHVSPADKYDLTAAMDHETASAKGKTTSVEFVQTALATILAENPHIQWDQLEEVGWVPSTNYVRAAYMPDGYGDVVIEKSWGEQPATSDNHVIVFNPDDAYFNLAGNLSTEWYPLGDMDAPVDLTSLPRLTKAELDAAID